MQVSVSNFRKNLFQLMDKAINGEFIEVTHKGRRVRLVAQSVPSKLDRLAAHEYPYSDEDFERVQEELSQEMSAGLERELEHLR